MAFEFEYVDMDEEEIPAEPKKPKKEDGGSVDGVNKKFGDLIIDKGGLIVGGNEKIIADSVVIGPGAKIERSKGVEKSGDEFDENNEFARKMAAAKAKITAAKEGARMARMSQIEENLGVARRSGDDQEGKVNTGIKMSGGNITVGSMKAGKVEMTGGKLNVGKMTADSLKATGGAINYGEMNVGKKEIGPDVQIRQKK